MQAQFTDVRTKVQKGEVIGELLRAEKQLQASEPGLHVPSPNYTEPWTWLVVTNIS